MSAFDLAIIGGGPGGYVAALRAAQLGLSVALVEREKLGGTCLHRGCIPSKALLHGAHVYETVQRAGEFGVRLPGPPGLDYAALAARKDKVVAVLEKGVEFLVQKRGIVVRRGEAAFADARTLAVRITGGKTEPLAFHACVIATGGAPALLPGFPMDGTTYVTSNEVLRWTNLPTSLAIIGAGVIGCEFASLYARLGVTVHVIELLDGALPGFDADVRKELERNLRKQGVEFHFGTKVEEAAHGPAGAVLTLANDETVSAQACVVAVGRKPFTEGLALEKAGLQTGRKGEVHVDERCHTSVPDLYAIGDVTGAAPFAHAASHMGLVVAEQVAGAARGGRDLVFDARKVPWAVFTRPEIAAIGLTEAQAREGGREVKVGRFPFRALGRAQAVGESEGFVKLIADAKTGALLGFHAVGAAATDLLGAASLAWANESSLEDLAESIYAHPTFPEAVGEAALAALGRPIHGV